MNTHTGLELDLRTGLPAPLPGRQVITAPELDLAEPLAEQVVRLAALRGRVVLLHFWAFGSLDCRSMLPILNRWQHDYGRRGLQVIGIHSPETHEERKLYRLLETLRDLPVEFPMLADQSRRLAQAYQLAAWPSNYLIDPFGRISWIQLGTTGVTQTEERIRSLVG